jgi:cytochrome c553
MSTLVRGLLLAALCFPMAVSAESPASREFQEAIAKRPDESRGREIFARCSGCHGPTANGTSDGDIPRIAGQHFQVLVRQLIHFRYGMRWNDRMEDVAMNLHILENAQDIADVAAFASHLDRSGPRGVGDGKELQRGAAIYAGRCAACHGTGGRGDDRAWVPRLDGQHAAYLERQMRDAATGRRPPMSRPHRKLFEHMQPEDIRGLSDYLARTGWEPPPTRAPPYDTPDK